MEIDDFWKDFYNDLDPQPWEGPKDIPISKLNIVPHFKGAYPVGINDPAAGVTTLPQCTIQ
jgi:hypothetical protein